MESSCNGPDLWISTSSRRDTLTKKHLKVRQEVHSERRFLCLPGNGKRKTMVYLRVLGKALEEFVAGSLWDNSVRNYCWLNGYCRFLRPGQPGKNPVIKSVSSFMPCCIYLIWLCLHLIVPVTLFCSCHINTFTVMF